MGNRQSHFNLAKREFLSPFLSFSFFLPIGEQTTIFIKAKNLNYKLSLYPFLFETYEGTQKMISNNQFLLSCYIGAMIILILFGCTLYFIFNNKLYFFYAACVTLSLSMMLINYDYLYIIVDELPAFVRNKNVYGFITTLLPLNYFLFSKHFLIYDVKIEKFINYATIASFGLTIFILLVFSIFNLSFFEYRNFVEASIFLLCILPIIITIYSFKIGYKPAWFFLIATIPVLLMGVLESISDIHNMPVQQVHSIYYAVTFFELFVLTIGLSIKFKTFQDDRKKVIEEMLDKEITAKEGERRRIAQDLHDKLGGLVSAAKLNFNISQNTKNNSFERGLEILDTTAKTIREMAHSYTSSSMLKIGVFEALNDQFRFSENPKIIIQNTNFNIRLSPEKENALFMIIQECIVNAVKHSKGSEVNLTFSILDRKAIIILEDDGVGYDILNVNKGLGLKNILFRTNEHLKGTIKVDSVPNSGTTIIIKFPI